MRISDWSSDVCSSDLRRKDGGSNDVGGQHPGDLLLRCRNASLNVRQGDIGDRTIERIHHGCRHDRHGDQRSEEHTSELQSLMRISYAVFCLKKKKHTEINKTRHTIIQKYHTQSYTVLYKNYEHICHT